MDVEASLCAEGWVDTQTPQAIRVHFDHIEAIVNSLLKSGLTW